ncbi:hypothetical protein ACHWQZ_G016984 [Mnemiopsis leidyi]
MIAGWRQTGDRMEAGWRQTGDRMEAGWRQNGSRMETEWKQDGDRMETEWKKAGDRMKAGWRQTGDRMEAGWRQAGDRLEAGWRQAGDRLETEWKRAGDRMEAGWRQNGSRLETEWRQNGSRLETDWRKQDLNPGSSLKDEEKRQSDYEAEVSVYRALENLEENIIVLHGFEYTHHQYRLCDAAHVKRGCSKCKNKNADNREGECDFLVVCQGGFVVIEVKNMEHNEFLECEEGFHLCTIGEDSQIPTCTSMGRQSEALRGTFRKSKEQREKVAKLIRCMEQNVAVLQFTAYPNFIKTYRGGFNLTPDQTKTIIFKEDLENFKNWWNDNVVRLLQQPPCAQWEKIQNFLLAVWCTEKNKCEILRCSLGKSVLDIDRKLKEGLITFQGKHGKKSMINNPGVVEAPCDVKNFIGVKYLTAEQYRVLNLGEN